MMAGRAWQSTACAALVLLSVTVSAGVAQAAPGKDGKPDKGQQQGQSAQHGYGDMPGKPGASEKPGNPARPDKPAKGQSATASGPTHVVLVCSYQCLADGTCAWVMRAETRPLPVPVTPR